MINFNCIARIVCTRLLSLTLVTALFGLSACSGGGSDTSGGESDTSGDSSDTKTTPITLSSPSNITLTKDFDTKTIKVSWQAVSGAKSYTLYSAEQSASALGENGFTNHSSLTAHAVKTGVTATEYTLSSLTQGKTYYVLVQAVNDSTQSAYKASDEKSIALERFEKMTGANAGKCILDPKANLMWEVKQDDNGLHGKAHTYTWYNHMSSVKGTRDGGTCYNKGAGNKCDTEGFVASVNAAGLCGFNDWRMPTVLELRRVKSAGADYAALINKGYWSSGESPTLGYLVGSSPVVYPLQKSKLRSVMLVRDTK